MKALTIRQPWASLIAHGVKTIETRSWRTHYRGPLAIHAGATPIGTGALSIGSWTNITGEPGARGQQAIAGGRPDDRIFCPLGAVVATARIVDCLPIMLFDDWGGRDAIVTESPQPGLWRYDAQATDITDQLPYGDFTPGRWAWLLDDVQPTTERCPACWGEGVVSCADDDDVGDGCDICKGGLLSLYPIPAKGRQGLWEWTP